MDATIKYKEDAKAPQTVADTDVIRIKDDIWLGDTSEIEYEGDKPLPGYLEAADGVTLVSNRPITLYEIGNMISQIHQLKSGLLRKLKARLKLPQTRMLRRYQKSAQNGLTHQECLFPTKAP